MDSNFKLIKDKLYVKNDLSIHRVTNVEKNISHVLNLRANRKHSYTDNYIKNNNELFTELFFSCEAKYNSKAKRYMCHQFITDLFLLAFYENSNLINSGSFSKNAAIYFKDKYYGNELNYDNHKFIMEAEEENNNILIDNTDEKTMKTIFNKYKKLQKCL